MHASQAGGLARASQILFSMVALVAAAVTWGWVVGSPTLVTLGTGVPMAPGTALGFLLLVAGFSAAQEPERYGRRTAVVAAVAASVVAVLTLTEQSGALRLGMDFAALAGGDLVPRRMSPAGSVVLILLSAVTPLGRNLRWPTVPVNAIGAVAIGAVALLVLMGLSVHVLRYDAAVPLLGLSMPEAACYLIAALGIALGRPSPWLIETLFSRRIRAVLTRWLLPAAFAVPLLVGWLRLVAEREGLFGEAFGVALSTLAMIACFGALVLWLARTLDGIEARRARAEEEAEEQRNWLQVTLAAIGDGVVATDDCGRVRFMNPAAERLMGVSAPQATGQPIEALLDIVDERGSGRLPSPLRESLITREPAVGVGEPQLRTQLGAAHAVELNAAPIIDEADSLAGAVLVLREASERRRVERAMRAANAELDRRVGQRTAALEKTSATLRERNALLDAITANTPDLIFAKSMDGRTLMANPAYLKVAERTVGGQGLDSNDRLVMESGRSMTFEEVMPGPEGERVYLMSKSPLRSASGEVIGLIGIATDITERRQAQRTLERLVVSEQGLRAEAEKANRAKDEFLAIVSHELRSPLNALRGWSHLLAAGQQPLDSSLVDRAARAIRRNVDHQARLIDDLLDTSRIVSGKLTIERRPVNLADIVSAAVEVARPTAAVRKVALRYTTGESAHMVLGDPGRLQQLVTNLLSNAIKFTPEGGHVELSLYHLEDRIRLVVRDSGIGIAPEFLPRVFDRFSQADTSSARSAGGLGIGLALVRHIADLHGGSVRGESEGSGRGATFSVDLPALEAATEDLEPTAGVRPTLAADRLLDVQVWLVDDDPDAQEVLALTLRHAGASVRSFGSARELIEALASADAPPEVLLMDIAMPEEDGFSLLRRVRALEDENGLRIAAQVPAIAVSALTQVESERITSAGFADLVGKPVDPYRLVAAIRDALEPGRPERRVA